MADAAIAPVPDEVPPPFTTIGDALARVVTRLNEQRPVRQDEEAFAE